ncbi:MAG: protein-glutamate O-methyltransferase [Thermodesulfovibrionales bacterium]
MLDNARDAAMTRRDFLRLSEFINAECGIKMPEVKKIMLEARLRKRLRALGITSFSEYIDYVFSPGGMEQELIQMIDLVTTNKTDFFREPVHFEYLTSTVLPDLLDHTRAGSRRPLMVWSAGCSTGEEPYTLGMVMNMYSETRPMQFMIIATDISTRVLETARKAVYFEEKADQIPPVYRKRYLLRSKDRSKQMIRIAPEIRQLIRFRRLNFMEEDFGFREKMDIIFCRNVIIYFDRKVQARLLNKFCAYLNPGGYVFMGHSETLHGLDVPLVPVIPTVYRLPR